MPNIEMVGFEKHSFDLYLVIAEEMRKAGLGEEVVVTINDSHVRSCNKSMFTSPYLRICATDKDEIDKVHCVLKQMKIDLDIETLLLHSFTPRTR